MHSLSQQLEEMRYERSRDRNVTEREQVNRIANGVLSYKYPDFTKAFLISKMYYGFAVHFHKKSMMFSAPIFVELLVVGSIISMTLCAK